MAESREGIVGVLSEERYSRLLICRGSVDDRVGVVHTKDLLGPTLRNEPIELAKLMVPPLIVPDRTPVLRVLDLFKKQGLHMAVVVDEFGTTEGVVTPTDVLEAIAGELPERGEKPELAMVRREDGSWLVDGLVPIDEFEDRTGIRGLREEGSFHTIAGFVLSQLGHLPSTGESFFFRDIKFEVVDMDQRRIDRILVAPPAENSL